MSLGAIPWNRMVMYGECAGLDGPNVRSFVVIIKTMDVSFLAWQDEETERRGRAKRGFEGKK